MTLPLAMPRNEDTYDDFYGELLERGLLGSVWEIAARRDVTTRDIYFGAVSDPGGIARGDVCRWLIGSLRWSSVEVARLFGRDRTGLVRAIRSAPGTPRRRVG